MQVRYLMNSLASKKSPNRNRPVVTSVVHRVNTLPQTCSTRPYFHPDLIRPLRGRAILLALPSRALGSLARETFTFAVRRPDSVLARLVVWCVRYATWMAMGPRNSGRRSKNTLLMPTVPGDCRYNEANANGRARCGPVRGASRRQCKALHTVGEGVVRGLSG